MRSFLLLLFVISYHAHAADILLENIQIVDVSSRKISSAYVSISGSRIVRVEPVGPVDFVGETYDMSGKFLIPGLFDMHTHSWGNQGPNGAAQYMGPAITSMASLMAGVTGFLDLFSPEDEIFSIRSQQRVGAFKGADIFAAGPIFTCSGGHGTEYSIPARIINTPSDARREIGLLAPKNPDVIKLVYDHARTMPSMNKETMTAAVQEAAARGISTVVHIGTWTDAREAVEAGATALTHLYEGEIPDELIRLMEQRGTVMIPTMAIQSELANLADQPQLLNSPLLAQMISADLLADYRKPTTDAGALWFMDFQRRARPAFQATLRKLAASKVRVLTGTDTGNLGVFQGYSVHREMKLLVEGGFTPWQALASATILPAEFLRGRADYSSYGIAPGAVANLVILNRSPIEDITNTESISRVIFRGAFVR